MKKNYWNNFIGISILLFFLSFLITLSDAGTMSHSYDSLNRLINSVYIDGNKTTIINYQYDAAGNMTSTTTVVEGGYCDGDFNQDGDIDGADLDHLIRNGGVSIADFAGNFGLAACP